ncbi:uncharacterized protein LACBIDRAFT_305478 [Laccaria bicolor S238N-H82]|uniref:Predicted protein n=1 Tax=Laccaria bicolor (strain S238N-H82 / ATCC MYA-4686) TaxID=486041 RepID=B0CUB9_LACBS|nr:uncharacterized protein LACBIDRAFT_305478 [Laccaria bicolor S238N-H82]EDR14068.1 predicted protein [Laccaria bicolor S238N-H82]|eukprot:XP_001874627.1 predicted protein [Laccaria bicolor S238N-H82]
MFNQSGSRRWTHFHSALQLAVQRSAHKWSFEDFSECFPLYVEEDKNGSSATFNSISDYIEAQNFRDLDKLFKDYNVQENIDVLHKLVTDAKERKTHEELGKDVWKEDLEPRVAVCARTIPILDAEVKRLRERLAKAKDNNSLIQVQLDENVKATDEANACALEILDSLDDVCEEWQKLPLNEVEAWTVQTAESLNPILRS